MQKMKKRYTTSFAILLLLVSGFATAANQLNYPEEILNQAKEYEDWYVSGQDAYGVGVVLMGQLVLTDGGDPALSAFRDNFTEGGYFATYLYPGRKMTFWQHGYEPVVLEYPAGKKGIVDVGKIFMRPHRSENVATVTGSVNLQQPNKGPAAVELWVRMPPTHLDDDGHLGGCRVSYRVKSKQVAHGESFTFNGLSPVGYELKYAAPGHIQQVHEFDHKEGDDTRVNEVSLGASNTLKFETISPLEHYDSRDLARKVKRSVEANGRDRLVFTKIRDELGNSHDFRFKNKNNKIEISYWMYPWYFVDLGQISLDEAVSKAKKYKGYSEKKLEDVGTIYTSLKSGHSYYFSCPENNISCVFNVSF
jgi:hypothetical protein